MPKITKISQQKSKDRVNVYLDHKFGFSLDLENFVKYNLKAGQELSRSDIEAIKSKGDLARFTEQLVKFACLRPRSRWEIERWLARKKIPKEFKSKLIKKLEKFELLNDQKFAEWWIGQRIEFRPRSNAELTSELINKHIDKDTIKMVLGNANLNEVELATRVLRKHDYKWNRIKNEKERFRKMSQYLGRKGYSWDVIKKAISID